MRTLKTLGITLALALVATFSPIAHATDGPKDEGFALLQAPAETSSTGFLVPSYETVLPQVSPLEQHDQVLSETWGKPSTPITESGGCNVTVLKRTGLSTTSYSDMNMSSLFDPSSGGSRRVQACGSSGVAPQ